MHSDYKQMKRVFGGGTKLISSLMTNLKMSGRRNLRIGGTTLEYVKMIIYKKKATEETGMMRRYEKDMLTD